MTGSELIAEVRAGRLAPIYLLYGPERLLLEEAAREITAAALAEGAADFNHDRFHGKETDPARLETALGTMPMMAPRRLVTVRDADDLTPAAREVLTAFARAPSRTTVVLILSEQSDARTSLHKAASANGRVVKFETPYERELVPWCRERARVLGVSLDEGAARLLVDAVGRDLPGLQGALERLALYVGPGGRVDAATVEEAVPETRLQSVFALCDAVGAGEGLRAWDLARKILGQREPPLRLLALLARHFRLLVRLRELREAGVGREEAGARLRLQPFALRNLWPQAERHSGAGLTRAMELLYEADLALKSSRLPGEVIVERLVIELARVERGARR